MYDKNIYSRVSVGGAKNTVRYRCSQYRKSKCNSSLKTIGKQIIMIVDDHNHEKKIK